MTSSSLQHSLRRILFINVLFCLKTQNLPGAFFQVPNNKLFQSNAKVYFHKSENNIQYWRVKLKIYVITNFISRFLVEKLDNTIRQSMEKKHLVWNAKVLTEFITASHGSISWCRWIHFPSHPIFFRAICLLFSHPLLGLQHVCVLGLKKLRESCVFYQHIDPVRRISHTGLMKYLV